MNAMTKKGFVLSFIALFIASQAFAAATADTKALDVNITLYSLVGLMFILLFVIGMLAYTLIQLTGTVRAKNRKEQEQKEQQQRNTVGLITLALLLSLPAASFAADGGASTVAPAFISGIAADDFYLLVGVISLELGVIFALAIYIQILLRIIKGVPEKTVVPAPAPRKSWFWDKFNNAASVEHEKDILLDHNYDGIQELDNRLPPWWKYGFYATIIVSVIYLYRFHISHDGLDPQQELAIEMQQGEEDKAAYLSKSANKIDETNVKQLTDPATLADAKELFVKNCAPCHVADGGGNVGPNLTDNYWLHGGGIKDIFKSIKYGWQDKGMKSWKDDLSPSQIQELASFIKSLNGSHPAAPKAPQGDLYIEVKEEKAPADTTPKVAFIK